MMRFLVMGIFCLAILSVNPLRGQPPPEEDGNASHQTTKHGPKNIDAGQPEPQALPRQELPHALLTELEAWVHENDNQWKTDENGANIFSHTQQTEFFVLFALLHKASCSSLVPLDIEKYALLSLGFCEIIQPLRPQLTHWSQNGGTGGTPPDLCAATKNVCQKFQQNHPTLINALYASINEDFHAQCTGHMSRTRYLDACARSDNSTLQKLAKRQQEAQQNDSFRSYTSHLSTCLEEHQVLFHPEDPLLFSLIRKEAETQGYHPYRTVGSGAFALENGAPTPKNCFMITQKQNGIAVYFCINDSWIHDLDPNTSDQLRMISFEVTPQEDNSKRLIQLNSFTKESRTLQKLNSFTSVTEGVPLTLNVPIRGTGGSFIGTCSTKTNGPPKQTLTYYILPNEFSEEQYHCIETDELFQLLFKKFFETYDYTIKVEEDALENPKTAQVEIQQPSKTSRKKRKKPPSPVPELMQTPLDTPQVKELKSPQNTSDTPARAIAPKTPDKQEQAEKDRVAQKARRAKKWSAMQSLNEKPDQSPAEQRKFFNYMRRLLGANIERNGPHTTVTYGQNSTHTTVPRVHQGTKHVSIKLES